MVEIVDGPASRHFAPLIYQGNITLKEISPPIVSAEMAARKNFSPTGQCICWGIPFNAGNIIAIHDREVTIEFSPLKANFLIFLHAADLVGENQDVLPSIGGRAFESRGLVPIGRRAARYVMIYDDGEEDEADILYRHQINPFSSNWNEITFDSVVHHKPVMTRSGAMDEVPLVHWAKTQWRQASGEAPRIWLNYLWAWKNPHPNKLIKGVRFEPGEQTVLVFGVSAGSIPSAPLRWQVRRKALLRLPPGETFSGTLSDHRTKGQFIEAVAGGVKHMTIDLGTIVSIRPRLIYPDKHWDSTDYDALPEVSNTELIVEYSANESADFHLPDGTIIPVQTLEKQPGGSRIALAPEENCKVLLRIIDKESRREIPARLHVHSSLGDYISPSNRQRMPNDMQLQDLSQADYVYAGRHVAAYVDGHATIFVPPGRLFVEVSRGFEVRPVRKTIVVTKQTREVLIEVEKVLNWRTLGWVTADTHVHYLSPTAALFQGRAEGVNVVNLLATQWGELFTNMSDFDGKSVLGSREMGGDGEYLVRVGTENRQGVLGHISLLGYQGEVIEPLCVGGPNESIIGDPINVLLFDWAKKCREQNGLVIFPHYPHPRGEQPVSILSGLVDALELSSLGEIAAGGLNPYSLADWYRYLNCGYNIPAVGGTDKMSAATAVGEARTYARLLPDESLTYENWKNVIRRGHCFVTFGPLVDMSVEGKPPGSRWELPASGGHVDVTWLVESATLQMVSIDLIINGEVKESRTIAPWRDSGSWIVRIEQSSWISVLVRARYESTGKIVIGAHTSAVMIDVPGTQLINSADAISILEQIEGVSTYLDNLATRPDVRTWKRMRMTLTSAHRELHNRLHSQGILHHHTTDDSPHRH